MARKLLSILSVLLVASMLLAACGGGNAASDEKVLRVWIQWGDNPQQIQELFDKYTAESGIKVEVTAPIDDDKVLPALTGSNPPDILVLSGGDAAKSFYKEGLVLELSESIKTGNIDMTDMYEAPLSQCRQGDKIVCLPWGTDAYALFWNKDLFEAAGLDPEKPPSTMEELVEYAEKLTIVGADGSLEQVGFIPNHSWSHTDLYARNFGGFWYSDDGTALTANSQAMIDALTWQQQFYTKYGVDNLQAFASGFGEYSSPDAPFYAGKVAMMVEGEWQVGPNFIPKLKPELNYGVAAFPPPADHPERAGTIVNQGTAVVIPTGVADKEASAKLLAWMMSPAIVAEEFCYNANLPTSKKAAEAQCFKDLGPKFQVFVDLMASPNAYAMITTPISFELNDALGAAEEEILLTGADPKETLDAIQAEFEPKFKEAMGQ
ncbi:MAG TPA: extracellular solute-binding protein [Anaerolineales bacterium]|nr:extracellular solute-binding protein [Anaerolineales bacterium]HRK87853.1 extracellular solute-binding protein [Anaerolineales bacterium]